MQLSTFATDYDGTLASNSKVPMKALEALKRLKSLGFKLILITGRQMEELKDVFPEFHLFDCIIAENGGTLFNPDQNVETLLTHSPPSLFIQSLENKNVVPLTVGKTILATLVPHDKVIQETLDESEFPYHVILNKESVMVLPRGISKCSGLKAAAEYLKISLDSIAGIGDAENDLDFLEICGYPIAVANALQTVKDQAQYVATQPNGLGVAEAIEHVTTLNRTLTQN